MRTTKPIAAPSNRNVTPWPSRRSRNEPRQRPCSKNLGWSGWGEVLMDTPGIRVCGPMPGFRSYPAPTLATCAWVPTAECGGLGIRAVEQGFSVQYFRFDELMTALKIDAGLPPARLKRRKYMSTALLLIDELGFEPMTRPEASLFFRLVTYRYGRGAILI